MKKRNMILAGFFVIITLACRLTNPSQPTVVAPTDTPAVWLRSASSSMKSSASRSLPGGKHMQKSGSVRCLLTLIITASG